MKDSSEEESTPSSENADSTIVPTYLLGYKDGYNRGREDEERMVAEKYFCLNRDELENLMDYFGPQYISHEHHPLVHQMMKRARVWLDG